MSELQTNAKTSVVQDFTFIFYFFKDFIYLFMRDTQRESETQAEGEVGSLQGTQCGARSQDPGSRPEPKADAQPLSHPGVPSICLQLRV